MPNGILRNGIIEFAGANTPGWISNLGLSLAGGVLTITDAQGVALSPSNSGWVTVPSTTNGQSITLQVTVPYSVNDDDNASSDLTNLGFGITETSNWANDVPFFLYVANRANSALNGVDGNSVFFLARHPSLKTTPSAANDIGDTGAIPVNDSQNVVLILRDVTVANYVNLPCALIGAIRMRWATATTDWTFQLGGSDGIGATALGKTFGTIYQFPTGQNGAAVGAMIVANGGTAPVFNQHLQVYSIHPDGSVTCWLSLQSDGGTDGVGAVTTFVSLPYAHVGNIGGVSFDGPAGTMHVLEPTNGQHLVSAFINTGESRFSLFEGGGTVGQNGDFINGDRNIYGMLRYLAFQ